MVEDFKARIKHYEEQYETLDENLEPDFSFLKIFNAGEKVVVHKHEGHIQSRIIYYLMNVKLTKRTIYLTRHGIFAIFHNTGLPAYSDTIGRREKSHCMQVSL